eukprot:1333211-Pyramimonas_sp.AAC.1
MFCSKSSEPTYSCGYPARTSCVLCVLYSLCARWITCVYIPYGPPDYALGTPCLHPVDPLFTPYGPPVYALRTPCVRPVDPLYLFVSPPETPSAPPPHPLCRGGMRGRSPPACLGD